MKKEKDERVDEIIRLARQAPEHIIAAARLLADESDLEATLLANQLPPGLLDEIKAISGFDPQSLTAGQFTQVIEVACKAVPYLRS